MADEEVKAMCIDLSVFNTVEDWAKVKEQMQVDKPFFVILRCGYRGYEKGDLYRDEKLDEYAKACRDNQIPFGLYFVTQAINEEEGIEEAEYTKEVYKQVNASLPIFIDCEHSGCKEEVKQPDGKTITIYHGRGDNLSRKLRTAIAKAFCKHIQSYGIQSGVYASARWLGADGDDKEDDGKLLFTQLVASNCLIWCASYGVDDGKAHKKPVLSKIDLWQYTSKGTVNGIERYGTLKDVDISYSYLDLNELKAEVMTEMEQLMHKFLKLLQACAEGDRNSCYEASELFKSIIVVYLNKMGMLFTS